MNNILITGSSGFIGQHLCKQLQNSYAVTAHSISQQGIPDKLTSYQAVIHLAALVHQNEALPDSEYFRINTEQTIQLATNAKAQGVKQFIFFSTVAVYGYNGFINNNQPLLNEQSQCLPRTAYGKSKLAAEQQLQALSDENFSVAILRPPIVYGPNCPGNMSKLKRLLTKIPVLPLGNQKNRRSMVAIANLNRFTEEVLKQQKSGVFIPQDKEQLNIRQISQSLAAHQKSKPWLLTVPSFILRALHLFKPQIIESLYGQLVFDSSASNQQLNFQPVITAEQALAEV